MNTRFTFELPDWLTKRLSECPTTVLAERDDRMRFVIGLARENVQRGTGGPFAAAIFDADGRLVAPAVNLVTARNCSLLHAEMVAIALAQQELGRYDLSRAGGSDYELVTSSEPCAMCFGAIPWSGITRLVCGARAEDAQAIGFDEGAKPGNWQHALAVRGIHVTRDILRHEAVQVLKQYQKTGGVIYNAPGKRIHPR